MTRTDRSERREGSLLILVSSAFVIVGIVLFVGTGHPIGLVCLLFFGGCLLVGVMKVVGEEKLPGRILLVVASFVAAAGCAVGAIVTGSGHSIAAGWRSAPVFEFVVMLAGLLLFGGGFVVGLIRLIRFARGDWARPPRRRRRGGRRRS